MTDEEKFQKAKTEKEVANAKLAQQKLNDRREKAQEDRDRDIALSKKLHDEFDLQYFSSVHLKKPFKTIAKPFDDVAKFVIAFLPASKERNRVLRKLLEAKDCAVRANLMK